MHGLMAALPTTTTLDSVQAGESGAPARGQMNRGDRVYHAVLLGMALLLPLLLVAITAVLLQHAWPSMVHFKWSFLTSSVWDPVADVYGAASMIFGTLASSVIALSLAV